MGFEVVFRHTETTHMFMTLDVAYIVVSKINIILGLEYLQKRGAVMV